MARISFWQVLPLRACASSTRVTNLTGKLHYTCIRRRHSRGVVRVVAKSQLCLQRRVDWPPPLVLLQPSIPMNYKYDMLVAPVKTGRPSITAGTFGVIGTTNTDTTGTPTAGLYTRCAMSQSHHAVLSPLSVVVFSHSLLLCCSQIGAMDVKVLNLHQGVDLNPYINYPFEHDAMAKQANFSRSCKSLGVESVKIYYTGSQTGVMKC